MNNNLPSIDCENEFFNPTLTSVNSPYALPFYQTKETLMDIETYRVFLNSAIKRCRSSRTYNNYKAYLIGLGMDRCQIHSNITNEMATIEMHHNMITIFDIALIITEHTLKTKGYISTFDLVELLKEEHRRNRVQLIMLSLTPHQLYHNTEELFLHPDMCFGDWYSFLEKYHLGLTRDVAYKILFYIKKTIEKGSADDGGLLTLRDKILDWSEYSE